MKCCIILLFICNWSLAKGQSDAQKAYSDGVLLLRMEKFQDAEIKFSRAIELGQNMPGLKMSYIYKGLALNGQNKYKEAINCFDKSIELDSLDLDTYIDRGKTYLRLDSVDKALADFNIVIVKDPVSNAAVASYYYIGRIKMDDGFYKEAITQFDQFLKLKPTEAEVYFLRGAAKSNLFDIDGSISDFDLAIKFKPDYMEAYANRGTQKINKIPTAERIGKAIDCLKDPCKDFIKAKQLGDDTVDDMIFLYCSKCKIK